MDNGHTNPMTSGGGQNINFGGQPMPQADNVVVPDNLAQPLNISTQIFSANGFDGGGMANGGAWPGMQDTAIGGAQGVMNGPLQPVAPGVMTEPLQPVAPGVTMEPLPPVMPMSLTTNNTSPKKKPNKWVIIGIVAVVLSLALAIVSVVVTSGPRGEQGIIGITDDARVTFNSYANYLLYGEESDLELDDKPDILYNYYFDSMDITYVDSKEDAETVATYYDVLTDEMGDFVDAIQNITEEQSFVIAVNDYNETLLAFSQIMLTDRLSDDAIVVYYLESGYENTAKAVRENYEELIASDYEESNLIGEALVNIGLYYLDQFVAYETVGCIGDYGIIFDCSREIEVDQHGGIVENESVVEVVLGNLRTKLINGIGEINEKIN